MRLKWLNENEFLNGIAILYSQAEAGNQARLVATTGIVKNRPLYVPDIMPAQRGHPPAAGQLPGAQWPLSLGS
jgi:hypothetical protein